MALKNLPGSVALNILQLIKQAPAYVNALSLKTAGRQPNFKDGKFNQVVAVNRATRTPFGNPVAALQSWYDSNINTKVTISPTDSPTIGSTFVSIADWANNFFVIRTQIISAIDPGEQPVITALDDVWKKFQAVTGYWLVRR